MVFELQRDCDVPKYFATMLQDMHEAQSAMTVRSLGVTMEAHSLPLTIEAIQLWCALVDAVPHWLGQAKTPEDYTFLANAIAGIANLTVIKDPIVVSPTVISQDELITKTKALFANWKAELRKKSGKQEAKDLLVKIEYLEACILNAKPPRRPKWEMITK